MEKKITFAKGLMTSIRNTHSSENCYIGITDKGRLEFIGYAGKHNRVTWSNEVYSKYIEPIRIELEGNGKQFPFENVKKSDILWMLEQNINDLVFQDESEELTARLNKFLG